MTRRHAALAGAALALLAAAAAPASRAASDLSAPTAASGPLLGFGASDSERERGLEAAFDRGLDPREQRAWLESFSSAPNQVGSPHDRANAERMLEMFRSWGWDAHIETFQVLYPTPLEIGLTLEGPRPFRAALHEPPIAGDPTSFQTAGVLPPYLAYQGDGDVTAEVVYANYGMPEDYKVLERAGIDVRGKIVLTRYGGGWRGLKPQLAQEHGAVGCLIYSDPAEDGYGVDNPYPVGGSRPPEGVQRGSVAEMMIYPGDPLTPGIGATADAKRLTRETAPTILKIPALPISYADARPFLEALGGPVAPRSFRGQLPITYHLGTSGAKAHLVVRSDWSLKPVYDVIAMIRGSEAPDEWVVRGNHHDGWVFGAWDPLSGNVALLQEAKAIGGLLKTGWRPKRTIVYASWDGEEPGLLGSTEWAEQHAEELKAKGIVYVNSDTNGRGYLQAEASHDLQRLINQAAADVRDPETGLSVRDRLREAVQVRALNEPRLQKEAKAAAVGDADVGPLGSGSDYSAFLQHLGLASINLGFGGEDVQAGVYHSLYDSFAHYDRFGDPGFAYGVALSRTAGRIVLRAADADVIPYRFGGFADTVSRYVEEVKTLAAEMKSKAEANNRLLAERAFTAASDPTERFVPPEALSVPPALDFSPLEAAAQRLKRAAAAYDEALAAGPPPTGETARRLNALLQGVDQTLLDPDGLPGRPWFKNLAYAPGVLTGYGAKTLPGVREALEGSRWSEAETYIGRTARVLDAYAARVEAAGALLGARGRS